MDELSTHMVGLSEHAAALLAVYDPYTRIRYANAAFRAAFFLEPGEDLLWADMIRRNHALGRGLVISDPDLARWVASANSRRGKVPVRTFESDLMDGRWIWITETLMADGWTHFAGLDITALRAGDRELRRDRDIARRAALTDELTHISNRRHMMEQLEALLDGRSAFGHCKACVCILDIDYFKRINDQYGHRTGDRVLVEFAHLVRESVRVQDSFGRIGGEEFMLLLPATTIRQAELIIQRVLNAVRHSPAFGEGPALSYTCSAGLIEIGSDETVESIYARADHALYAAKQGGRDRVCAAA
jgi:diguanylate cyclase (GGDEF)-like protein